LFGRQKIVECEFGFTLNAKIAVKFYPTWQTVMENKRKSFSVNDEHFETTSIGG